MNEIQLQLLISLVEKEIQRDNKRLSQLKKQPYSEITSKGVLNHLNALQGIHKELYGTYKKSMFPL